MIYTLQPIGINLFDDRLYRFRKSCRTIRQMHTNVVHKKLLILKECYLCLSITETEKKTGTKNSERRYIYMGLNPNFS